MIAVTNVTNVMIVTNVIKKFESLQKGSVQLNPFVTAKKMYMLFLHHTCIPKHRGCVKSQTMRAFSPLLFEF